MLSPHKFVCSIVCLPSLNDGLDALVLCPDEASMLMSLSRHRDADLLLAFDACFEGTEYKGEIDEELFLVQVRGARPCCIDHLH